MRVVSRPQWEMTTVKQYHYVYFILYIGVLKIKIVYLTSIFVNCDFKY